MTSMPDIQIVKERKEIMEGISLVTETVKSLIHPEEDGRTGDAAG